MAGGRLEMPMGPTAIGLVSFNSNSETHMTAICVARLIYGRRWISRVFVCCAALIVQIWRHLSGAHDLEYGWCTHEEVTCPQVGCD